MLKRKGERARRAIERLKGKEREKREEERTHREREGELK